MTDVTHSLIYAVYSKYIEAHQGFVVIVTLKNYDGGFK